MGSGNFNTKQYQQSANSYVKQDRQSLFQQSTVSPDFDPTRIKERESCASTEHPDPTSIIIACDVTGSMGKIPEDLLKSKLGKIMESLLTIKSISNPQVMFAAVGDTEHDKAPLQVTQFESDNRIEKQLKNLYLEGGGGGNHVESYHSIWYFAANKTKLDSLKTGKKGLLFTMGDEKVPPILKAEHIRKFIDKNYQGDDISTSQLVKDVTEKYDVFHLIVQDTSTYSQIGANNVNTCWQQYLGERAIIVPAYTAIPEKIISTIRNLCELNSLNVKSSQVQSEKKENNNNASPEKASIELGLFSHKPPKVSNVSSLLNKDSTDNIPYLYKCPISDEVMDDPVIAKDGFTYDRKNISEWVKRNGTSPKTREPIDDAFISNRDLKSEIEAWKQSQAANPLTFQN